MFYLKNKNREMTTIDIIYRFKGHRYKFPTGEKVPSICWLKTKERCIEGRNFLDGADINIRLAILEKHVKNVFNNFALNFKIPDQKEFTWALKKSVYGKNKTSDSNQEFSSFIKLFIESCDRKIGTKKNYQTTLNWIKAYENKIGSKLLFSDINSKFYRSFKTFIFSSETGNSPNFFGTMIKNIKVFMNHSFEIHHLSGHKESDFKKIEVEADNIYLSVEELIKLHTTIIDCSMIMKKFSDITTLKLAQLKLNAINISKKKFLIGAFTALRVSDFNRIEELNIADNKIRIRTYKNDKGIVIPVHWIVKEILDSGFNLSYKISHQKINDHIKEACMLAGIINPVSLSKFEKGNRIMVTKPKCDWVTTHTARRSGATNMYLAGIPSISIMKITGHRTEKSFLKYIKISQEENADLLAKHEFFKYPTDRNQK